MDKRCRDFYQYDACLVSLSLLCSCC